MINTVLSGLLIPFIGTAAGAGCVFFLKNDLKENVQKALSGFAAGVMVYVVVEELIPEASQDGHSNLGTIGFTVGFIVMMILEILLG